MICSPQLRFELRGEFGGFIRTASGKRRMLLRNGADEWRLKVPKPIRQQLSGQLTPGHQIAVAGVEHRDSWSGAVRRVVSQVQLLTIHVSPPTPSPCASCTIRVCAKKNCWKSGGKELWVALQQQIDERGIGDAVKLKAVGCLGNCKRAPNAVAADRHHERCGASAAGTMLAQVTVARTSGSGIAN